MKNIFEKLGYIEGFAKSMRDGSSDEYLNIKKYADDIFKYLPEFQKMKEHLKSEQDAHNATVDVLQDVLKQLNDEVGTKTIADDIRQYFIDIGVE